MLESQENRLQIKSSSRVTRLQRISKLKFECLALAGLETLLILCFLTWFSLWAVSSFFGFTLILHFPTNPSFGTLQSSPPCPLSAAPSSGSRQRCGNLWDLDYIGSQPSPSKDSICTCLSLKSIIQILFYISQLGRTNRLHRSLLFATPGWGDFQYNNYLLFLSWK